MSARSAPSCRRLLPWLALCLAAPVVADVPAANRAVFKGGIDLVHLHVTVTDAEDHSVTGLRQQDFTVYEDGVPQPLAMFNGDGAPLSVVLMIDGSGSMDEMLPAARLAAERVLAVLRPGDRVDVLYTTRQGGEIKTSTLLQNLLVLSVGGATTVEGEAVAGRRSAKSVSLSVTTEQAQLVVEAKALGRLTLALRNPEDVVLLENLPTTGIEAIQEAKQRVHWQAKTAQQKAEPARTIEQIK